MIWVLAGTNTILPAQFKWTALNFNMCMHWWATDGDEDDDEGGSEWGRWVTSVNPHSEVAAGLRTEVAHSSAINLSGSVLTPKSIQTDIDWKVLIWGTEHVLYTTYAQRSPYLVLSIRLYACENVSNTVQTVLEPCWETKVWVFIGVKILFCLHLLHTTASPRLLLCAVAQSRFPCLDHDQHTSVVTVY